MKTQTFFILKKTKDLVFFCDAMELYCIGARIHIESVYDNTMFKILLELDEVTATKIKNFIKSKNEIKNP